MNQHSVIYCWRQVDATVTTSINKSWRQVDSPTQWLHIITINVATTVGTSINKSLCQHADDKSPIESTMVWLGRSHLSFAAANCVLNLRFAMALLDDAATAGSCDRLLARPAV